MTHKLKKQRKTEVTGALEQENELRRGKQVSNDR